MLDHIAGYFTWPCAAIAMYYVLCTYLCVFLLLGLWESSKLKVGWKINLNYPAIRFVADLLRIAICQFFVDSLCSLYESDAQKKSRNSRSSQLSWTWQVSGARLLDCCTRNYYELEEKTNIFSKWLLSSRKIFLSFHVKIFFSSDDSPIWEDINEH